MRIMQRKRKMTMDINVLLTLQETLFDAKKARVNELLGAGVVISDSTIDKDRAKEREDEELRRELESLRHQVHYYKDTTKAVLISKDDLQEEHNKYRLESDAFLKHIVNY
jgi:hypothetical protein